MNGKTCDAEIGRLGHWRSCLRRPTGKIRTAGGVVLEYCSRHHNHASNPTYMTPATFARLETINQKESI